MRANNPGMVGELDRRGRLKTPDVHAEVFKQLTDSLKISKVTEADFSSRPASSYQPCLPPSLLGDFITRWTPKSLVTLLDLLFPVPPYCRRPICFFSHARPGAHVSVVSRCGVWPSYLVNTL